MLSAGVAAKPASRAKSPAAVKQTAAQLLKFLGTGKVDGNNWRLNRHWVGTMKTVIANGPRAAGRKDEPVRFNVFADRSKPGTRNEDFPALMAAGKYGACYWTPFRRELPALADLRNREKLPGILKSFGDGHGDGWGMNDEMHWSESWLWFTLMGEDRIRVLSISASTLEKKGKQKELDGIEVREGIFRPSDPADPEDVRNFPSYEVEEAKRQAEIDAKDDGYPEPLRSYLKAKHDPRGSGLKIWFAAVRKFRANPDGALLKQLVARMDESESTGLISIEIPEMIKTLFHDETAIFEKEIGGWNEEERQQAQALLLDALPEATNRESLEMAVELATRETGVGPRKTDIDALNVKPTRFEIPATIPRSSFDLKSSTARRAGEILRAEILGRWKKGK